MSHYSANIDDFAMDSRSMAGPLEARLKAARDAGFTQITLSAADLASYPGGADAAVAAVQASGLRVSVFQTLADFEGLSGPSLAYKIGVAKSMLEMCHAVDCHLLVASASTLTHAASDTATLIRNLRQLAMLAIPMNIRIAYKAWSQGAVVKAFMQAWDLVCQADMPNLGLCLDTVEMLASGASQEDIDYLDAEKLFLVLLADSINAVAPHFRVFPGEGEHNNDLAAWVTAFHRLGYRGDYSLAVFNDDYQQLPPPGVAQRAWGSALWLGQDVLQRSVPLPNQIRLKRRLAA
jgi:sugar phosphate isomerase/epimerase